MSTQAETDVVWRVELFGSGSMVVVSSINHKKSPHIRIGYCGGTTDKDRYDLLCRICDILNGDTSRRTGLVRIGEFDGMDENGIDFYTSGPFYDANPPKLLWTQVEGYEAESARARLIDKIFGVGE